MIVSQCRLSAVQGEQLLGVISAFVAGDAVEIVARWSYERMENSRRCVPREPADWAPVALAFALAFDVAVPGDHGFLGCDCPTWTVETFLAELGAR